MLKWNLVGSIFLTAENKLKRNAYDQVLYKKKKKQVKIFIAIWIYSAFVTVVYILINQTSRYWSISRSFLIKCCQFIELLLYHTNGSYNI